MLYVSIFKLTKELGEFMSLKGPDQDLLVVNMQLRTRVMDAPQNASAGCDGK
jgi:hypothetical protein